MNGFNYEAIKDSASRKRSKQQAGEIRGLLERSGAAVVEIGQRLTEVRGMLSAAVFRGWVEAEFCWQMPTASNYMQAAKVFGDAGECLNRFQPFALTTLSRKNVPAEVHSAALKLARDGQTVTGKIATKLIHDAGVKPKNPNAGKARKPQTAVFAAVAAAASSVESVEALRQTIDNFSSNVSRFADSLDAEARERLADRFLRLAMELRGLLPAATTKPQPAPRRRRELAASA